MMKGIIKSSTDGETKAAYVKFTDWVLRNNEHAFKEKKKPKSLNNAG